MFKKLLFLFVLLLLVQTVYAVPLAPEIIQYLKDTGQFQQFVESNQIARSKGVWQANPDPVRFGLATDVDTLYCILVLCDFPDMPYTAGNFAATPEDFDSIMFSRDVFEPGSMADYYFEVSYGQALLIGEITDWYRMPNSSTYYADGQTGFGTYPRNAQRLAEDAVRAADPDVDYSPYDNNDDGMVDGLFVVHAGPGYENTGNPNHIHSHAWVTYANVYTDDGVYVSRYSMEPEEDGYYDMVHIGVFCHEFGHVLGLPDLYDTDYDSDGIGMWSIMASGSWGQSGRRPVHFDAWCKKELGFVNPVSLTINLTNEQIDAVEYFPDVYRLNRLGGPFTQFFLVENRQLTGFDLSLPGSGLLIYHVDETQENNNDQNRYMVAIEQADGDFDLEGNRGSDSGDPWPGLSNNRAFNSWSIPNSDFYSYGPTDIAVTNISNSASSMFADMFIMINQPLFHITSVTYDDSANGNNNHFPEEGETCDLIFQAMNIRAAAENLTVTLSIDNPLITISDALSEFDEEISYDEEFDNSSDVMTISIPSDFPENYVTLTLAFSANDGSYEQEITFQQVIGEPAILLVDDDNGDNLETYYIEALDELDLVYMHWDVNVYGIPTELMYSCPEAIWFTGDTRYDEIPAASVERIINYLDNGGKLLITSQDCVQRLAERSDSNDVVLLENYLKVFYYSRSQNHYLTGNTGTSFEGLTYVTGGEEGANNQSSQDALNIRGDGVLLLSYSNNWIAGVGSNSQNYRAVTLGFGIEAINNELPPYNTRASIIDAARDYLYDIVGVKDDVHRSLPNLISLSQNYPNPFNAFTLIKYELPQQSYVRIDIYDILGRNIVTIQDGLQPAGKHQIVWDAEGYSSGIYFYQLQAGDFIETQKMNMLK